MTENSCNCPDLCCDCMPESSRKGTPRQSETRRLVPTAVNRNLSFFGDDETTIPLEDYCLKRNTRYPNENKNSLGSPIGLAVSNVNFKTEGDASDIAQARYATYLKAFARLHLNAPSSWDSAQIDDIMKEGLQLYTSSQRAESNLQTSPEIYTRNEMNILREFELADFMFHIELTPPFKPKFKESTETGGRGDAEADYTLENLMGALNQFFRKNKYCLINVGQFYVLVWRTKDFYFVFDACGRRVNDFRTDKDKGVAMLICLATLENVRHLIVNLSSLQITDPVILRQIKVVKVITPSGGLMQQDYLIRSQEFQVVNDDYAYLKSNLHLTLNSRDLLRNRSALPVAVFAMVASKIDHPATWDMKMLDKIICFGVNFCQTFWKKCKTNDIVDLDVFPNTFTMGQFQITIEGVSRAHTGTWRCVPDYLESETSGVIKDAFEMGHQKLIFQINFQVYAIWKKNNFIYLLDPFRHRILGKAGESESYDEMEKTATLRMFRSFEVFMNVFNHILLESNRTSPFSIHTIKVKNIQMVNGKDSKGMKAIEEPKLDDKGEIISLNEHICFAESENLCQKALSEISDYEDDDLKSDVDELELRTSSSEHEHYTEEEGEGGEVEELEGLETSSSGEEGGLNKKGTGGGGAGGKSGKGGKGSKGKGKRGGGGVKGKKGEGANDDEGGEGVGKRKKGKSGGGESGGAGGSGKVKDDKDLKILKAVSNKNKLYSDDEDGKGGGVANKGGFAKDKDGGDIHGRDKSGRPKVGKDGSDILGRDNKEREGVLGKDKDGREILGRDKLGRPLIGKDNDGKDTFGTNRDEKDALDKDKDGKEILGRDKLGRPIIGKDKDGKDIHGTDNKEKGGALGKDKDVREILGKNKDGREILGRDKLGKPITGKEKNGSDIIGGDKLGRPEIGKDKNGRDMHGTDNEERGGILGKDKDGREILGRDKNGGPITGKDKDGRDGRGTDNKERGNVLDKNKDGREILGRDKNGRPITGKDKDGRDELGTDNEERGGVLGKDKDGREILGKDKDGGPVIGKDKVGTEMPNKDKDGSPITDKVGRGIIGTDKDVSNILGTDKDGKVNNGREDIPGKTSLGKDILGTDKNDKDIPGKDQDFKDIQGKDKNLKDIASKDKKGTEKGAGGKQGKTKTSAKKGLFDDGADADDENEDFFKKKYTYCSIPNPNRYPGYYKYPLDMAVVGSQDGRYESICKLMKAGFKVADRVLLITPWGNFVIFRCKGKSGEPRNYFLFDGCTCNFERFRHLDLSIGTAGLINFKHIHNVIEYIRYLRKSRRKDTDIESIAAADEICQFYCNINSSLRL